MPSASAPESPAIHLPTVLDVEASGFGRNSYPIEIGFVLPDARTFCALIRPLAHWTQYPPSAIHPAGHAEQVPAVGEV